MSTRNVIYFCSYVYADKFIYSMCSEWSKLSKVIAKIKVAPFFKTQRMLRYSDTRSVADVAVWLVTRMYRGETARRCELPRGTGINWPWPMSRCIRRGPKTEQKGTLGRNCIRWTDHLSNARIYLVPVAPCSVKDSLGPSLSLIKAWAKLRCIIASYIET